MRKLNFLVLLLVSLNLMAVDEENINSSQDSTLIVYLEQSDKDYDYVDLVFENTSLEDTIKLVARFKYFGNVYESYGSGFNIHIYRNNEINPMFQTEINLLMYEYGENGYVTIPPNEKINLPVSLSDKIGIWDKSCEYGASFLINYRYVLLRTKESDFTKKMKIYHKSQVRTNYIVFWTPSSGNELNDCNKKNKE